MQSLGQAARTWHPIDLSHSPTTWGPIACVFPVSLSPLLGVLLPTSLQEALTLI